MSMRRCERLAALVAGFVLTVVVALPHRAPAAGTPEWNVILGPAQGGLPTAQNQVTWRPDLMAALAEAKQTNRALFVVLRCLPCEQCSAFDKELLAGSPAMDPLLQQFVTVRLIAAHDADERILRMDGFQDLDMSLWGYFLSPEGRIYSVFGGRDEVSDTTRISEGALVSQMKRVLAHHYDPRRPGWDVDGPAPDLTGAPKAAKDLPGYASWMKDHPDALSHPQRANLPPCLHCHQVGEVIRQAAVDAGTFDKNRDSYVWPLPENVGVVVERDDGLKVTAVTAASAAAKAGIQVGDELAMAGGRILFGQTDFRGVLHRAPFGPATIEVMWRRGDRLMSGRLELADGWRKTVLDWRASVTGGNIGASPGFWPQLVSPVDRQKLGLADDQMAYRPWFGRRAENPAGDAGLTQQDVIVAVGGQTKNFEKPREFLTWFRFKYDPGDTVELTAVGPNGRRRQLSYKAPRQ